MSSGSGQPTPASRARRRHSPAAVAPMPREIAILRLHMPAALSRSTSRIFRMGNLCWAILRSLLPGREAMPIPASPNGARHTPPQPGRHGPERVGAINRNRWSPSPGAPTRSRHFPNLASQKGLCAYACWGTCVDGLSASPHNRGPHEVRTHLGSGNPDLGPGWGAALSSPSRWRCCRPAHGPDHMQGVIELSVIAGCGLRADSPTGYLAA
jgi:hypothetical protein